MHVPAAPERGAPRLGDDPRGPRALGGTRRAPLLRLALNLTLSRGLAPSGKVLGSSEVSPGRRGERHRGVYPGGGGAEQWEREAVAQLPVAARPRSTPWGPASLGRTGPSQATAESPRVSRLQPKRLSPALGEAGRLPSRVLAPPEPPG